MFDRRQFFVGASSSVGVWLIVSPVAGRARSNAAGWSDKLVRSLKGLEQERGGRLGVAVLDTQSGRIASYRGDERFPVCSTFKTLVVAATLARVDTGKEQLERRIRFTAQDVVVNSAITKDRAGGDGMSLAEVCEAAMVVSDNTAGNLLLTAMGGPAGLTAYARSIGDPVTRLDRFEPALNEALPDDVRDTTSPSAMLKDLHALVTGDLLAAPSKARLIGWLIGNKTGGARIRAGLPRAWKVGDKTGSGERGTTNTVAVIWPASHRAPIFVSAYLTGSSPDDDHRNATLAAVGRAVAASIS